MKLYSALLLGAIVVAGCSGSGAGRPPSRSFVTLAGADGVTAAGFAATVRVEAEEPDVFEFTVVSWPSQDPVVHTISSNITTRSAEHTLTIDPTAPPGWYAVIARPTDADLDVRASGGVVLDDGSWALRFRTDSAPRIRLLGSARVDESQVTVDIEFSEALESASVASIRVSLGDNLCAAFENLGELITGMSLECAGSSSDVVVSIDEDVAAPAGGVLHAREIRAVVGEVYRDPI